MSPFLEFFVTRSCALASLAYAAKMKRLGHGYFLSAVAGVFERNDGGRVVYSGSMPRLVTMATADSAPARRVQSNHRVIQ